MLQITPQHKIYIAINSVNFRKGIDGLVGVCKQQLQSDPFSGYVFVFANKLKTSVKILNYDGNGFWLCQKRFSQGKIKWWPATVDDVNNVRAIELAIMLQQGHPFDAEVPQHWRRLAVA